MKKFIQHFSLVALIIGTLLLCVQPVSAQYAVGDTVADFTLNDLNGNPVSLSDFSGQYLLLNFFATW